MLRASSYMTPGVPYFGEGALGCSGTFAVQEHSCDMLSFPLPASTDISITQLTLVEELLVVFNLLQTWEDVPKIRMGE